MGNLTKVGLVLVLVLVVITLMNVAGGDDATKDEGTKKKDSGTIANPENRTAERSNVREPSRPRSGLSRGSTAPRTNRSTPPAGTDSDRTIANRTNTGRTNTGRPETTVPGRTPERTTVPGAPTRGETSNLSNTSTRGILGATPSSATPNSATPNSATPNGTTPNGTTPNGTTSGDTRTPNPGSELATPAGPTGIGASPTGVGNAAPSNAAADPTLGRPRPSTADTSTPEEGTTRSKPIIGAGGETENTRATPTGSTPTESPAKPSATPPKSEPVKSGKWPVDHTIVEGDSLWKLADEYYDKGTLFTWILEKNPKLRGDGSDLRVGDVISIPAPPESAKPRSTTSTAPAARAGFRNYVIREGDTLYDIAVEYLDNGMRWSEIEKANPGIDPNNLKVGRTIQIPAK